MENVDEVENALAHARAYAQGYYQSQDVMDNFGPLLKYRPEVFTGYMTLREAAFNVGPTAALTEREKELVLVAIEVAIRKRNGPAGHARRAIRAGATVQEVAEVVSLCLMICGMITYVESGRYGIEAAEAAAQELGE